MKISQDKLTETLETERKISDAKYELSIECIKLKEAIQKNINDEAKSNEFSIIIENLQKNIETELESEIQDFRANNSTFQSYEYAKDKCREVEELVKLLFVINNKKLSKQKIWEGIDITKLFKEEPSIRCYTYYNNNINKEYVKNIIESALNKNNWQKIDMRNITSIPTDWFNKNVVKINGWGNIPYYAIEFYYNSNCKEEVFYIQK